MRINRAKKKDILWTQFKSDEFKGLLEEEFDECPVCLYDVSHCYCETNNKVIKDEPEYLAA